jgi:hypothetical protein
MATEAPTAPKRTDADEAWRIHAQGVGPIRVGATLREANEMAGTSFAPGAIGDFDGRCYQVSAPDVPGITVQVEPATRPDDPLDGPIAVIYVEDGRYRTDEDVGVGSTEVDVWAAYPTVEVRPDEYAQTHNVMTTANDSIHFETDGSAVTSIQVGSYRVEGCA